jgi:hypothetical protein
MSKLIVSNKTKLLFEKTPLVVLHASLYVFLTFCVKQVGAPTHGKLNTTGNEGSRHF